MNPVFYREIALAQRLKSGSDWEGASLFLFGPRMTGKSFLLRELPDVDAYYDLLDESLELRLSANPREFWEELRGYGTGAFIVIDEVQRLPQLLNFVQKSIEELDQQFILSGSSARKLRRGGANLLGGRALDLRLHPLTTQELGDEFKLDQAISFGTLPRITVHLLNGKTRLAIESLKSYVTTYIKEEIQAEAVVRRLDAFQRFLAVAAASNAQVIEYATISRDCGVAASVVKEYYSILEDTLLGRFLWPMDRSERKKARPKFYFFDCGVARALQNRLQDPPTSAEKGLLFETWFINEFFRIKDYARMELEFGLWREGRHEVDLVVHRNGIPIMAFEIKSGAKTEKLSALNAFRAKFPGVAVAVISSEASATRVLDNGLEIWPYAKGLQWLRGWA